MIKERILNLEGKRKRQDKFGPIRIVFGKKWQFFSKREREDKSVRARCHNQRREVRKTVVRYERGEG
jgi:hypothetical protein